MSIKRKISLHLPHLNLRSMAQSGTTDVLERYINHLLDIVQDTGVVLPTRAASQDPENGELLFTGSKLYLSIGGSYYQVYPATGSPTSLTAEAVEEDSDVAGCTFPYPEEAVYWEDISLDPATGNQALVASSAGKSIVIVYLETNNPDSGADTEIYFHFSSDGSGTKLFRKSVPKAGGTVVQNFVGAQPKGASGTGLYATTSGSASDDLYVTVGYVLL